MSSHHLAQLNIARALEPLDSDLLAPFVAALDEVNAVADGARGFVWRLQTEAGDATAIRVDADPQVIVNMSLWESVESLWDFVYGADHLAVMRRRREWFASRVAAHSVLWWVPRDHRPELAEGMARLDQLDRHGPGPDAFTFKASFGPDGRPAPRPSQRPPVAC